MKQKKREAIYMIRFNNDYNRGAHPAILEALARTNTDSYGGRRG